ncbi:DMT family transporter [Brevibacillus sp. BC25]|uniref:DMT family transporter n=1 Tax=Brevibacillus sp. BC25 TaxID=1144308 RepID=UPI00027112AE|nr:EamA family transporter [Brevibacillus sp. BC25]EJL27701.1 EamA-like transporter family [Brevibacillus sp. BC25]
MVLLNYVVMCLIFGTTFLAIKVGIDAGAPPFFSAGIRFFLAGVILFSFMLWKKQARLSLLLHKEMFFTGIGLTFGTFATLYWAEQHISSGIAAILSATAPLMVMLLQTGISRQKLSAISWAGCLVGFAGVVLLILPGATTISFSFLWLAGCIAVLFGQIFYSAGAVYSRSVIQRFQDTSPIALNAAQMMYGGAMLLVLSLFTEQVHIESMLTANAIISLLYLIVVGSMMGHTIFYWLVAKTNPVFPSTWLYISPLIALSLGVILYNEPLYLLSLAGGITIIVGIILINMDGLKKLMGKKVNKLRDVSH